MDRCIENVIEFLLNQEQATLTLSQGRFKSRIRKLSISHPEECRIIAENKDGSICAHIPISWVKFGPPRTVTEEQAENARQRMNMYHSKYVATT